MFGRIVTLVTLGAMIALTLIMQSTTPLETGPGGILTVFFLLYVICTGIATLSIYATSQLVSAAMTSTSNKKQPRSISVTSAYYYGSIVAIGAVVLLAMKSAGAISIYEYVLVGAFEFIAIFYIQKRTK